MKRAEPYDLIVIGGGPAGCTAAAIAAKAGLRTLLLEKDRDFGCPVRCAGVLDDVEELRGFIPPDPKWIENSGKSIRIITPNGASVLVDIDTTWVILNRKVFDYALARQAAEFGSEVRNRCCAVALTKNTGTMRVTYEYFGKTNNADAPLVIGADGPESRVGRWRGLRTSLAPIDIWSCYQYTIHHKSIEINDVLEAYLGKEIAPEGYLWVFPLGLHYANVGVGIPSYLTVNKSAKQYLDEFIAVNFSGASFLSSAAGAVPSAKVTKGIVGEGIMLAGDAAHQTCPLTGGGIIWGMWGGKLAAETAVKAHAQGDFSIKTLISYYKSWNSIIGSDHSRKYRLRNIFRKVSDEVFNRTGAILQDVPPDKRSKKTMIQLALANAPGLIKEAMKAYLG